MTDEEAPDAPIVAAPQPPVAKAVVDASAAPSSEPRSPLRRASNHQLSDAVSRAARHSRFHLAKLRRRRE